MFLSNYYFSLLSFLSWSKLGGRILWLVVCLLSFGLFLSHLSYYVIIYYLCACFLSSFIFFLSTLIMTFSVSVSLLGTLLVFDQALVHCGFLSYSCFSLFFCSLRFLLVFLFLLVFFLVVLSWFFCSRYGGCLYFSRFVVLHWSILGRSLVLVGYLMVLEWLNGLCYFLCFIVSLLSGYCLVLLSVLVGYCWLTFLRFCMSVLQHLVLKRKSFFSRI